MNILISVYSGLGNFLLKMPLIDSINSLMPECSVDLIGQDETGIGSIAGSSEHIDRMLIFDPASPLVDKVRFVLTLRKSQYDVIFFPFDSSPFSVVLLTMLLGGKKIMHTNTYASATVSQKIRNLIALIELPNFKFVPVVQGRHEIDLNYDLLEAYLNKPFDRGYRTNVNVSYVPKILDTYSLIAGNYLVIQPSAANGSHQIKVWRPERFLDLVSQLRMRYPNLPLVFVGDDGDRRVISTTPLANLADVINLLGKTSIAELMTILSSAKLVIAHDSGAMHLSNALGVPLIALYGPTDYTRTRPMGPNSHILFSHNRNFARMYGFRESEMDIARTVLDYECMDGITVTTLLDQVSILLGDS